MITSESVAKKEPALCYVKEEFAPRTVPHAAAPPRHSIKQQQQPVPVTSSATAASDLLHSWYSAYYPSLPHNYYNASSQGLQFYNASQGNTHFRPVYVTSVGECQPPQQQQQYYYYCNNGYSVYNQNAQYASSSSSPVLYCSESAGLGLPTVSRKRHSEISQLDENDEDSQQFRQFEKKPSYGEQSSVYAAVDHVDLIGSADRSSASSSDLSSVESECVSNSNNNNSSSNNNQHVSLLNNSNNNNNNTFSTSSAGGTNHHSSHIYSVRKNRNVSTLLHPSTTKSQHLNVLLIIMSS